MGRFASVAPRDTKSALLYFFPAMRHALCALALLVPACSPQPVVPGKSEAPAAGVAALDRLLGAMGERLELMHEVARVKWNAKRPIRDAEREAALLGQMVERGRTHALEDDFTRTFFTAQMEAARLVQEADFDRWRRQQQPPFAETSTLEALRQRIDAINQDLLAALAAARLLLRTGEGKEQLRKRASDQLAAFSVPVRETALRPLVRQYEPRP